MVNVPLMQKVFDHIEAHPEEWDQRNWAIKTEYSACGTAYCFAGHAVNMTGHKMIFTEGRSSAYYVRAEDGGIGEEIEDVAAKELDLNSNQAYSLFRSHNTIYDLYRIANAITNGAITVPDDIPTDSAWSLQALKELF